MQRPTSLYVHLAAYTLALTFTACGALDGADSSSVQNQVPSDVSPTTTPDTSAADMNNFVANTNTTSPNTVGNANTTGNGNTMNGNATNSNAMNGNAMNANVMLDCSKTWNNYAKAFFTNNCASCHSHNHSNLTNYDTVKGKASTCQTYISAKIMPVGATLPAGDYNNILNWFACKMPE